MAAARPKEFDMDEKWDKVVDTFLRRAVYGSLAGGFAGLLLLRKPSLLVARFRTPCEQSLYPGEHWKSAKCDIK